MQLLFLPHRVLLYKSVYILFKNVKIRRKAAYFYIFKYIYLRFAFRVLRTFALVASESSTTAAAPVR